MNFSLKQNLILACAGFSLVSSVAHGQSIPTKASAPDSQASDYISPWLNQTIYQYAQFNTRNGPKPVTGEYLEYEFFGNTGPLELYGYVDFPKDLDIGNANSTGIWDGGSRFFAEIEPRLSFGKLLDRDLAVGPIKDWLIAVDYTFDDGSNGSLSRSANLNIGLGTTIDFGIPLRLQANFYERYWGENYGRLNSNSWDGYRAQFVYSYPIMKFADGSTLSYGGYTNIDFDSKLHNLTGNPNTTSDMLKSTHGLIYKLKHYSFGITAQYYEHGGQSLNSTGWAGLAKIGYRF